MVFMNIKGAVIDFLILSILFFAVFGFIFGFWSVLYKNEAGEGTIFIVCKPCDSAFLESVHIGDVLYDHITKRRIGHISDIEARKAGYNLSGLTLTVVAERKVVGGAVRTANLLLEVEKITEGEALIFGGAGYEAR